MRDTTHYLYSYIGCFDQLAVGCLAAYMATHFQVSRHRDLRAMSMAFLVLVFFGTDVTESYQWSLSAISIATALYLLGARDDLGERNIILKPLELAGSLSYEIYLFHIPILALVVKSAQEFLMRSPTFADYSAYISLGIYVGLLLSVGWFIAKFYAEPANRMIRTAFTPAQNSSRLSNGPLKKTIGDVRWYRPVVFLLGSLFLIELTYVHYKTETQEKKLTYHVFVKISDKSRLDPIMYVGAKGSGDLLFLERNCNDAASDDKCNIRIGIDHWGAGSVYSKWISADKMSSEPWNIEISKNGIRALAEELTVISTRAPAFPDMPPVLGVNDIGFSSADLVAHATVQLK